MASKLYLRVFKYSLVIILLAPSTLSNAIDFSTDFESTNFNTVQDFSVHNNGLSVQFSGGTSFTIGNGLLCHSGTKSWMIDPAGTTKNRHYDLQRRGHGGGFFHSYQQYQ